MDKKFDKLPNIFAAKEAYALGITPADLKRLSADGELEHPMRGVYKKANSEDLGEWTQYEIIAKGLKCKYAVCLLSALSYHQLTDQIVDGAWILIDHVSAIHHKGIRFLRKREPKWEIGIDEIDGVNITDIHRTLVEAILYKNKLGPNEAYGALVKAINQGKAKSWDIMKMAKDLGVEERVGKYLEPFIYAS